MLKTPREDSPRCCSRVNQCALWAENQTEADPGPDPNLTSTTTALDKVRVLISHGTATNMVDDTGRSALHDATILRNATVVNLLLDNGADY